MAMDPTSWQRGDPITAAKLQQMADAIRELQLRLGDEGYVVRNAMRRAPVPHRVGKIVAAGPSSEADFTDNRYWVQLTCPASADGDPASSGGMVYPDDTSTISIVCAANVSEESALSHLLATDGTIYVELAWHADYEGSTVWTFSSGASPEFDVRVTSSTQDGDNKRWSYSFVEIYKSATGYNGWSDKTGGRTGSFRNLTEDQNGATGTWGNGIVSTDLPASPATMTIKPIPNGTRIRVWTEFIVAGSTVTVEYWTQYENGVTGSCS